MDNPTFPPSSPLAVARFVPDRRVTALAAGGVLVALAVALLTSDRPGRLLALVAALILAVSVLSDLLFSPRLEASAGGVVIRSPFTRATLRWADVETVRLVSRSRLGLRNEALEIDAGAVLAEFTRRTLGTGIEDALLQIEAVRRGGTGRPGNPTA